MDGCMDRWMHVCLHVCVKEEKSRFTWAEGEMSNSTVAKGGILVSNEIV